MDIGKLEHIDITTEAKKAYLDYAMSVIVARALPDVRDGLKPVHRRILFAMHETGLTPTSRFVKSAKIIGETMGNYHPHGDMPIYDALVRLAQSFSMRYPLIIGQGNFGSIDGDPPAAMRYTEAKMALLAQELLFDINKDTVNFILTFDGSRKEPVFLPAKLPNLLLMGSEGIAVGMATKIPPHNLSEVVDAIVYTIKKTTFTKRADKKKNGETQEKVVAEAKTNELMSGDVFSSDATADTDLASNVTIDELLGFVKGPDFPTGGAIYDLNEIKNVYKTGRGKIIIRGIADIEDIGLGKSAIIIRELPYQVNKATLVAKIAELAKDKKLEGISDLRDESDRHGIRIVVELKRDATPRKILNNLFKQTSLQSMFPANFVALVDGIPRTLNLKMIVDEYIRHRFSVVTRRSQFELKEAQARIHILDGLLIAVNHIDEVIKTIRASKNSEDAKSNLMTKFKLSDLQATAILDMQLRKLSALEREKLEDEWKMIKETIDYLLGLLGDPVKILGVIKDEILKIKEKYQDERRTRVYKSKVDEFSDEDLIQNEPTVLTVTKTGYIKRQSLTSFKTQRRGGKGINAMTTKGDDVIEYIRFAKTHDYLLFFTNLGKVYQTRVFEIPESSRIAKGQAIPNLIDIEGGETISSLLSYGAKDKDRKHVLLVTKKGVINKTETVEFSNIRRRGIAAIKLDPGDALSWADFTTGSDDILLVTKNGKIISFPEKQVRATGRSSMGVRGIKLIGDDQVTSLDVITNPVNKTLFVLTERGLGKRTRVSEFRNQNRGGQGIRVANITEKSGKIVFSTVLPETCEEIIITSEKGLIVKIHIKSIPLLSRNAQGVILMRFSKAADKVAAATCIGIEDNAEIPIPKAPIK